MYESSIEISLFYNIWATTNLQLNVQRTRHAVYLQLQLNVQLTKTCRLSAIECPTNQDTPSHIVYTLYYDEAACLMVGSPNVAVCHRRLAKLSILIPNNNGNG